MSSTISTSSYHSFFFKAHILSPNMELVGTLLKKRRKTQVLVGCGIDKEIIHACSDPPPLGSFAIGEVRLMI